MANWCSKQFSVAPLHITELNDVPSPADGALTRLRPIAVNAHFALNQGLDRSTMKENEDGWLALLWLQKLLLVSFGLVCLVPVESASATLYIRMARSLLFLPTFYNFPWEMLCANGPNL